MPELPEVETIRRGLNASLKGETLRRVEVRERRLRLILAGDFATLLRGRRVESLGRRGKYLLMHTETPTGMALSPLTVIMHFGMSGSLYAEDKRQSGAPRRHAHVVFHGTRRRFVFHDPRRFGLMVAASCCWRKHPLLRDLGPEPLDDTFNATMLRKRLAGRTTGLKNALMEQKLVAGLGNIYACETMHRARLPPDLPAQALEAAPARALCAAIKTVLKEAIAAGGSTLRDYRGSDGQPGYFQHHFAVYGREGKPCPHCRAQGVEALICRLTVQGRGTFYCPRCQGLAAGRTIL